MIDLRGKNEDEKLANPKINKVVRERERERERERKRERAGSGETRGKKES
jgi:hypothetical protein